MADIKGITIEIDGNVSKLSTALSGVNKDLKSVQSTLRSVDKALKLDPTNVELLEKKQKGLQDAIADTKEKLDLEKQALAQLKAQDDGSEEMAQKQRELEREITATEASLSAYESELGQTEAAISGVADESEDAEGASEDLGDAIEDAGEAAEESSGGWSMAKQMLVDFAESAAKAAIQAVKELAGAMKDAVVDSAAYADEMLTLSTTTNLSTDTLQEFQYMSQLIDVDLNTVTGSLTKLTKNMTSAASGSGATAEAFAKLGVSATDSNGELRSSEDVFYDIIDALGKIDNETERDAVSMSIFGKSAQELNPMIEAGTDAIKGFADEAHQVGYVLDEDTLSSLGAVDDSFQRMKTTMTATRNNIVAQMAPALAEGGNQLLEFAQSVDWEAVGATIGQVVSAIVSYIPTIIEYVQQVYTYLQENVIPVIERVWQAVEPVVQSIRDYIVECMPEIAETVGAAMEAVMSVIQTVWPAVQAIIEHVMTTIKNIINIVTKLIQGDWQGVWDGIKKFADDRLKGIKNIIQNVFNVIKTITTNVWNSIKTAIQNPINAAKTAVRNAITSIKSFLSGVKSSAIVTTFTNIKEKISDAIETAKEKVKAAIDKIKGFLSGEISFPHIKLPHFRVYAGEIPWGLGGKGTPPKISIDWYRKAMNQAILLNGATIFGAMGGNLMGGGEAGKEVILGLDKLKEYAGNKTVNISMTVNAAPGQDAEQIARECSRIIQNEIMRKKAVWA